MLARDAQLKRLFLVEGAGNAELQEFLTARAWTSNESARMLFDRATATGGGPTG